MVELRGWGSRCGFERTPDGVLISFMLVLDQAQQNRLQIVDLWACTHKVRLEFS